MTNVDLIEKKDLREQMIGRVEVLDKVKSLFLIPELEVMTVKQVAEYFEVDVAVVKKCYQRNSQEIDGDGTVVKTAQQLTGHFVPLEKSQGQVSFMIAEGVIVTIPNRGIRCFSKRAVLRIAMLLRDSEIAKEVRTQLLNTFEHSTEQQRTDDIDEEMRLMLEIGKATMSGDIQQITFAYTNAFAFKNRHIAKLEEANEKLETVNSLLIRKTMEWGDRAVLNALMRSLAANCFHNDFKNAWNALYRSIKYKFGIDVHNRKGNGKLIQRIKNDEFSDVISMAVSLCEANNIDVSKVINEINESNIKTA